MPVTFPLWFGRPSDEGNGGNRFPRLSVVRRDAGTSLDRDRIRTLAAQVRAGDPAAYETLYRMYFSRLRAVAFSYVRATDRATDIVSDVFTAVWERRAVWNPPNVEAYLVGAVRNRALNVLRDTRRTDVRERAWVAEGISPGAGQSALAPDTHVERDELRRALRVGLARLSERQRIILALRWHQQMDWPAIGTALGISTGAVQTDHSRALRILRRLLEDE